jgi:hypothetical protein
VAKGERPQYFSDPAIDKLLAMVVVLAQELSVTRERLATVERLIESHGLFKRADIDGYELDDAQAQERSREQQDFIARLLRTLIQEIKALEAEAAKEKS